ncbi:MAG: hypothetical protein P8M16_08435 [Acidimicrobiales bacterium]|nr:hypothetical protein [Acidimicrobiales bacterium]
MDLYYDPVIDEHVANPLGLMAPVWYLAPQRPKVARSAWELAVMLTGLDGEGDPAGLNDPAFISLLAMQTGEFDNGRVQDRLWEVLDDIHEPNWDPNTGEFTFGFGLGEPYPRGQLNARAMAGWVCTPGAWSKLFDACSNDRFTEPTVSGVDFPNTALSEAQWDGDALHVAAQARNESLVDSPTSVRITALPADGPWILVQPDDSKVPIEIVSGETTVELRADGRRRTLRQS